MSVGLKPRLPLCHDYSQGFVLGPLLFTDTRCADDIGLFVSSKIHSQHLITHARKKHLKKASLMVVKLQQKGNYGLKNYSRMPNPDSSASLYCPL